jgi:tetratricopeptide (TPR) repeat protein
MKQSILFLASLLLLSCNQKVERQITNIQDYDKFLVSVPVKTTSKYFELWNSKIKPDSIQLTSFSVVGGEYNRYFQQTGAIDYLKKSEQALKKAVEIAAIGKPSLQRALARNYISQHRFKEALQLAEASYLKGNGLNETQGLLFDIHMELGNHEKAERYLDSIKNSNDFSYLIRKAKWQDYKGYLEDTITLMEEAKFKAEGMKNENLMLWSYTNLADYYGHAGKIEDSYQHYLKSLEIDPQNAYAKKGIAWIIFSHEKNPEEALRILDSVTLYYKAPDYYLLKAEIAQYMGEDLKYVTNLDHYFKVVENPQYGDMYNAYNIDLYLGQLEEYGKAMTLAKKEVANRPTAESYSLLATAYLKMGEKEEALAIIKQEIEGKTFEPAILFRAAKIYKANGEMAKVAKLKEELLGASYELGPVMENEIGRLKL